MIDLTRDSLPSALIVGGEVFPVDTSFRTWMKFQQVLVKEGVAWEGVFADAVPDDPEWVEAALEFLASENATPRGTAKSDARAVDLVLDGDYIAASFQQAYGIDLTCCDMHWHRFKALLNGLPENTILSRIIGYRTWTRGRRDMDAERERLKREWARPDEREEELRREALEAFDRWAEG